MRLDQWCCLNFMFLGLTSAANSKSQQLSAAQVVAQSRKVLKTTSASEDEPLRYLVVESEQVASAAAHGSGQNALVQAIEAALGKGGVARRLSDGEETKEYKYYKNVGVAILEVDRATPDSAAEAVVESLQASSAVGSVEADSVLYPIAPTSDDNLREQEIDSMGITDDYAYLQWGMVDVGAYAGWQAANLTADFYHPTVMVIDTGIDYRHEDLGMNAYVNREELYGDAGVDDDDNGYVDDTFGYDFGTLSGRPHDNSGPGTHIAGIIGAVTNNGLGVAGMHYGATLVPCKIDESNYWALHHNLIACIDYAIAIKVDVINNSNFASTGLYSEAVYQSLQRAAAADILIVTAAGNSGNWVRDPDYENGVWGYLSYPCCYDVPSLLCIGATTYDAQFLWWSNYGPQYVSLAAPGLDIYSTYKDQQYMFMSGTNSAAAFVSGAAAFLKSVNRQLTNIQIVDILQRSAVPFPDWESKVKHGKLNMAAAVELAMSPNIVMLGAAHHACEAECTRYGWQCDNAVTTQLNTDLNYCFATLKADPPKLLPKDFSIGGEANVNTLPYGCFVDGAFEVGINRMTYGVDQYGCRAATAFGEQVWRVCSCKS